MATATDTCPLLSDVCVKLADDFLSWSLFESWQHAKWLLRCAGGPGSGKTTLASIVTDHLRGDAKNAVASVFFTRRAAKCQSSEILETFSQIVNRQLFGQTKDGSYTEEASKVQRAAEDLRDNGKSVFIIVDGLDILENSCRSMLEVELLRLQSLGICIFATSRYVENSPSERCDEDGCVQLPQRFWWQCQVCNASGVYRICVSCKQDGMTCLRCGTENAVFEPCPPKVEVHINEIITEDVIRDFVAWDIEREHGFSLSRAPEDSSRLSIFGRHLYQVEDAAAKEFIDAIAKKAASNITLAKLRLDNLLDATSMEHATQKLDELPANLQKYFARLLMPIKQLPKRKSDHVFNFLVRNIIFGENSLLDEFQFHEAAEANKGFDSMSELLRATNGVMFCDSYGDVEPYNQIFDDYVKDNYDEDLFEIRAQLSRRIYDADSANDDISIVRHQLNKSKRSATFKF